MGPPNSVSHRGIWISSRNLNLDQWYYCTSSGPVLQACIFLYGQIRPQEGFGYVMHQLCRSSLFPSPAPLLSNSTLPHPIQTPSTFPLFLHWDYLLHWAPQGPSRGSSLPCWTSGPCKCVLCIPVQILNRIGPSVSHLVKYLQTVSLLNLYWLGITSKHI